MFEKRGFFDSPFDFNGDGRIDIAERAVMYKIFEDCIEQNNSDTGSLSDVHDTTDAEIFDDEPYFPDSDI
jgi:hypothetical protein